MFEKTFVTPQCDFSLVGLHKLLTKLLAQGRGKLDQLSAMFAQDSALLSKLIDMTPVASFANFLVMPSAPNV